MARDAYVHQLEAIAALAAEDLFLVVDDPAGTPLYKKATGTQLVTFLEAAIDSLVFSSTGCKLLDTGGDQNLTLKVNENLSANRVLSIVVGDGDRTIALAGDVSTVGGHAVELTTTGATAITLPESGTLATIGDKLSAFAATTSAELAGVISDETGTGALVFADAPTITSPTLVTPVLGEAVATTINKVTITAPATGSTLTIQNGFTLLVSGNATINQDVSATARPTFAAMTLTSGTPPASSPADAFQMYSADFAAGNACPTFRTENGTVIVLSQSLSTTSSPTFAALTSNSRVTVVPNATGAAVLINRLGSGNTNGALWGIQVERPAGGDALTIGVASSTYTTGGAITWLGNSNGFVYVPTALGAFRIGVGTAMAQFSVLETGVQLAGVVIAGNATPPGSSPADAFQMYSADQAAGNACPHIRTENGGIVKLYQQAAIANAVGGDEVSKINAILGVLRNAGLIAT